MADEKPKEKEKEKDSSPVQDRNGIAGPLAKCVVYGSITFIILTSLLVLAAVVYFSKDLTKDGLQAITATWKDVLTVILPVLGAWVGTILAFYFTKENFEAANRSVREMVGQVSVRKDLRGISAKAVMVPRGSITDIRLEQGKGEDTIHLDKDVVPKF